MDAALKLILCDGTVLYIGPMTKNDARLYVQYKGEECIGWQDIPSGNAVSIDLLHSIPYGILCICGDLSSARV